MAQITDNFNRTAETPLSNGGVWSVGAGSYDNVNTDGAQAQAAIEDSQFCVARATTPSIGNDQYAQIVLTVASNAGGGGPCVRMSGANQAMYGLQVLIDDGFWASTRRLLIFDSTGAETQLATTSDTITSGDTIRLEISGTTLTAKKNGAAFSPALTFNDNTIASGQPGFMLACNTPTLSNVEADDFDGGDLSSGPTAAQMAGIFEQQRIGSAIIGRVDA